MIIFLSLSFFYPFFLSFFFSFFLSFCLSLSLYTPPSFLTMSHWKIGGFTLRSSMVGRLRRNGFSICCGLFRVPERPVELGLPSSARAVANPIPAWDGPVIVLPVISTAFALNFPWIISFATHHVAAMMSPGKL
jgi:hypothetical protein